MNITKFLKPKVGKLALGVTALSAIAITAGAAAVPAGASTASNNSGGGSGTLFITSAVEHPNGTVTFPLHQAKDTFAFLVSDRDRAFALDGWLRVPERVPGAVRGFGCRRS